MKKPILKIKAREFIDWMYSNKEDIKSLGLDVANGLIDYGKYSFTLEDVWRGTGYIPKNLVINSEVAKWNKDNEIEEPARLYDVEWVN